MAGSRSAQAEVLSVVCLVDKEVDFHHSAELSVSNREMDFGEERRIQLYWIFALRAAYGAFTALETDSILRWRGSSCISRIADRSYRNATIAPVHTTTAYILLELRCLLLDACNGLFPPSYVRSDVHAHTSV